MAAPLWDNVSSQYKTAWDDFFLRTDKTRLPSLRNLDQITRLAMNITSALQKINPHGDDPLELLHLKLPAKQWHMNELSRIKEGVARAIEQKRNYYDKTIWGRITKLVLKLFGLWNNGNTACIRRAEEFLFQYDSRYPLTGSGKALSLSLFSFGNESISVGALRDTLDLRHFYNYTPNRAIEVHGYGYQDPHMPRFMVLVRTVS